MQPLQCTECNARVLVQKNSWEHTSVQWNPEARKACRDLGGGPGDRPARPEAPRQRCGYLTRTIEEAARSGAVDVLDPTPVRPLGLSH